MSTSIKFPLSDEYLPKVSLTEAEITQYRVAVNEIVAKTLEQEIEFRYRRKCKLDEDKWKFVKAKDRLKVYKRVAKNGKEVNVPATSLRTQHVGPLAGHRRAGSAKSISSSSSSSSASAATPPSSVIPMIVCIGKVDGRMEDALYGVHHKTTDEMRITTTFLNKHHLDSAVLHTIDTGTDTDPFRYLGIKWRIAETPGGNLISNRDVCVLEYVGTGVDALGYKYGFHVIKSLDAPWFPEFPDPHIVRARMMLCCIYRQIEPNVVDCYMKGVFDLGGGLIDMIAYNTAADTLLGISKTVLCAEAKKLTLKMILEQRRRLKSFHQPGSTRPQSSRSVSSAATFSVDRSTSTTRSEDDVDSGDEHGSREYDDDDVCSVCHKQRSVLSKLGSKWDRCRVCRGSVCSKCHMRKKVFARPRHIKVPCCTVCIIAARELPVDPRDPYPIIGNMINDSNH